MPQVVERKEKERELHDRLRGNVADDPRYNSNKRFYAIAQASRDFEKRWLAERCPGKRVLDYCCGDGGSTIWLAQAGAYAHGIDISPVSIRNATNEAARQGVSERVTFGVMDAEAMTFPDNYFDFVVINGVLHHLDLNAAYRELARVLKPEGEIICTEALRHNVFIHLYRKLTPRLRSAWEVDHILGKNEIELAKKFFHRAEPVKFFHLATIGAIPFRNLPFFPLLRRTLEAIDSVLLKIPLLKWQAWMVVFVLAHPKRSSIT